MRALREPVLPQGVRVCCARLLLSLRKKKHTNLPASLINLLAMFSDIRALHEGVQMTSASILAQKPSADESEWAPLVCRSVLTAKNSHQCAGESVIEIVISSEGKMRSLDIVGIVFLCSNF